MNARLFAGLGSLDGPIAKAILNLIAKYLTEHGDEILQKLLDQLMGKLFPADAVVSAADDPVCAAFAVDVDAALAGATE